MSATETPEQIDGDELEELEEPATPEPEGEPEEPEQSAREAAAVGGSAELEKKLERAVADHRRRLGRILDTDLAGQECPTCGGMGYTPGGVGAEPELVHPDNLVECDKCNGYGQWRTGSKNPSHELAICTFCTGYGYQTITPTHQPIAAVPPVAVGPREAQAGTLLPDGRFLPFGSSEPITLGNG